MKRFLVALRLGLVVIGATPAKFMVIVGITFTFAPNSSSAQMVQMLREVEALETGTPRLRERGLDLETSAMPWFEPRKWERSSPTQRALIEAVEGALGMHDEPSKEKDLFPLENLHQEAKKFFQGGNVIITAPIIVHRPAVQYVGPTVVENRVRDSNSPNDSQVLRGNPVGGCPLLFHAFHLYHYQIVYQRRYLDIIADDRSPLSQDVCECRLLGGDYATCARQAILSSATAYTGPMSGGVEVFVTDPGEFENLFAYISTNVPVAPETLTSPGPTGGGNGNGEPPVAMPPEPPRSPQTTKENAVEENSCERSGKICISSKGGKISAEFSVKCKNMPEYTFSTEGEASIKVGPIGVSFSPE
jgi:hypothetical protein